MRIDLVFFRGCPNVDRVRAVIRAALMELGEPATWTEWDRNDANTPEALRRFASPTVLVNGRDVAPDPAQSATVDGDCCRVYKDDFGHVRGAPSAPVLVAAIRGAR